MAVNNSLQDTLNSERLLSNSSFGAICPNVDMIEPNGLYAWTRKKKSSSYDDLTTENCLVLSNSITTDTIPSEFCDFIFPVLMGYPHNTPLNDQWINRIPECYKPGCYLVSTTFNDTNKRVEQISVTIGNDQSIKIYPELMEADLCYTMFSANSYDKNFTLTGLIDQLDDIDVIYGYHFPAHKTNGQIIDSAMFQTSQPVDPSIHCRHMKRYQDLNQDQCMAMSFSTQTYCSERMIFLLAQDSYVVLIDHNWQTIPRQRRPNTHKPYLRLIRPGSCLIFDGLIRYANLSLSTITYLSRRPLSSGLIRQPLFIVHEGVKAFDVFYANDGLDATFIDCCHWSELIQLDWHQIQLDFKMDHNERSFKGHIVTLDELTDVLATFQFTTMICDMELAAKLDSIPNSTNVDNQWFVLNLQNVVFNYINSMNCNMNVVWNVYAKLDHESISSRYCTTTDQKQMYVYLRSYNCVYNWKRSSPDLAPTETNSFEVIPSIETISPNELYRIGWSRQEFDQQIPLYHNRLYPYQSSILKWLLEETRKVTSRERYFHHATTLGDRLIFRNSYYNVLIQPCQS